MLTVCQKHTNCLRDLSMALSKSVVLLQDEETESDRLTAEKEMKEAMEKEAEVQRLKEECVGLKKRKREMQLQTLKYTHYREFLERVLKLTKVRK